jgi:hypothetical protein
MNTLCFENWMQIDCEVRPFEDSYKPFVTVKCRLRSRNPTGRIWLENLRLKEQTSIILYYSIVITSKY